MRKGAVRRSGAPGHAAAAPNAAHGNRYQEHESAEYQPKFRHHNDRRIETAAGIRCTRTVVVEDKAAAIFHCGDFNLDAEHPRIGAGKGLADWIVTHVKHKRIRRVTVDGY